MVSDVKILYVSQEKKVQAATDENNGKLKFGVKNLTLLKS